MTLFWLLWVTLVLAAGAGVLAAKRRELVAWLRPEPVPALARRPVPGDRRPAPARGSPLPLPRVATRSGPPFRPPA
jgi:hypothetical protein